LGKKGILFGALETFIDSVRDKIATIRQACCVKDYEGIAAAAHGIKGGAANLTANRLADLASDLEEAANRHVPERVGGLVDGIEEEFHQLEQYCRQNDILPTFKEKKRKILIVEDEIISQTKLALILEDFGKCDVVDNGKDAITLANDACQNNDPYGLIMLDINLPEMDGINILSSIRAVEKSFKIHDGREAKILMISSYRDRDRIIACVQSGCNDYIAKPFVAEVVRKKLAELGIEEGVPQVENNDITVPATPTVKQLVESISSVFETKEINLPTLPKIQVKFHKLSTKSVVIQRLVNLLKKDVAISTALIRISNSAHNKGLETNKTLEQAITRLGIDVTEQIVDELSGRDFITMKIKKYRSLMENVWKHSIACASASEITSNLLNIQLATDPFSMGLLH
jgi:CheY-like chemotaxis protein